MTTQSNALHVADDVLIRIADDEPFAQKQSLVYSHLDVCQSCAERLGTIQRRTRALSALLQDTDPAMPAMEPPAPRGGVWPNGIAAGRARYVPRLSLKAAAVILLIAGTAAMASPVRARVLDWIRDAFRPPAPAPESAPVGTDAAGSASVEFLPVGDQLVIEVVDAAAGGELRISRNDGRSVIARPVDATSRVELLVLPSGLRIGNTGATATYEIGVPEQITRIRVQVAQGGWLELAPAQLPLVIPIRASP